MKIDATLKQQLIAYFEAEHGPLYDLSENCDIGHFDDQDFDYPNTLSLCRDQTIPLDDLGWIGDVPTLQVYRLLLSTEAINAGALTMECWYCGKPAVSIWKTDWDDPGQNWPACDICDAFISCGVQLRKEGQAVKAAILDDYHGIYTGDSGSKWIARSAISTP